MPAKKRARENDDWAEVKAAENATRTSNPIREIVDKIAPDPNHPKPCLKLSIGDPTLDGNLLPPPNATEAIVASVTSNKFNGYLPAIGAEPARDAVAKYHFDNFVKGQTAEGQPEPKPFTSGDVVLSSGASQAIEMSIGALLNPGDTLLLPKPGFSLYKTICSNRGIKTVDYQCVAERNWEVDLEGLEKKGLPPTTKAILVNNPSNPCGSSFSRAHIEKIVAFADKYKLPIISDEIYAGLVFADEVAKNTFTSIAAVSTSVPSLIIGGTAKNFVAPGWRLGWVIRHDPKGVLGQIWGGINALATLIVGPQAAIQGALPNILLQTPAAWTEALRSTLQSQAMLCYDACVSAPGLNPVRPQGAMYLMVGIEFSRLRDDCGMGNDVDFASRLMKEENVQVLPGTIFGAPGFIRIVYTKPADQLKDAVARIVEFMKRYSKEEGN